MRVLLDTHAFLWWLDGDRRLSRLARQVIGDESTTVYVSAASAWEITTKFRLGKLPGAADVASDVLACAASQGFEGLAISIMSRAMALLVFGPLSAFVLLVVTLLFVSGYRQGVVSPCERACAWYEKKDLCP